ncbi:DUF397 domain-containing protein [Actinomadura parmotrematis]|uniref:DUF397 domain-containing protein n=1 Tax=Actinomadura parmotrematis TaxID=2864039 RepID=A0ABS7FTM7_9ACTN|nr:DUF397 domain-containing protein [Actinomadura parmotrematis]MBW8483763.1 DUF397 domain-containing protein [Actinomadura parmotrematis]
MDMSNAAWRKSTYSNESGSNCVELAATTSLLAVRDSQAPQAGYLLLTRDQFAHLSAAIKAL